MRVAWKRGIGIVALALSVALGVHATLPRAAAAQAAGGAAPSQTVDQGLTDPALVGAFDAHAHMAPDSAGGRSIDVIDLAKMEKARGMRGFVMKDHTQGTAALAYLTRKEVPGLEVFGSIVLNRAIGMNAEAVRAMTRVKGGWGRIVWMPSQDNEYQVRSSKNPNGPFVAVSRSGELLPEVKEVLGVIAKTRTVDSDGELVLATGHVPPEETLMILREAKNQGVKHMVVTHPIPTTDDGRPEWTLAQMQEAAKLGALIEVRYRIVTVPKGVAKTAVENIRKLGVENCILVSDLGGQGSPFHPDGLAMMAKYLRSEGFTNQELNRMMKENPARLMGLPLL